MQVVLAACSPLLHSLLVAQPSHPTLLLQGARSAHLRSVILLMYHGEARVAPGELLPFLELVRVLGVRWNRGSPRPPTTQAPGAPVPGGSRRPTMAKQKQRFGELNVAEMEDNRNRRLKKLRACNNFLKMFKGRKVRELLSSLGHSLDITITKVREVREQERVPGNEEEGDQGDDCAALLLDRETEEEEEGGGAAGGGAGEGGGGGRGGGGAGH